MCLALYKATIGVVGIKYIKLLLWKGELNRCLNAIQTLFINHQPFYECMTKDKDVYSKDIFVLYKNISLMIKIVNM